MLQPERIFEQVQSGPFPATWRVFRGRKSSPLAGAIILGIFSLFFFSICEGITGVGVSITRLFSFTNTGATSWFLLGPIFLLIPITLALLVGVLSWRKATVRGESLLILVPEGVVLCNQPDKSGPYQFKVLDFATINSITLKSHTSSDSSHVSFHLDVQQRNGEWQRWPIDARFGPAEATAQYIIANQALYIAHNPF